ncbi:MAG: hypothetical protein M3335_08355 [Actinomycetota bacterium]|nr:hypothetical protein [Actinomycetota bacterium]
MLVFRRGWLGLLLLLALAGLNAEVSTADKSSASDPAGERPASAKGAKESKVARHCAKRKGATAAKRRACGQKQRQRKQSRPADGEAAAPPLPAAVFAPANPPEAAPLTPPPGPEPSEPEPADPESPEEPPEAEPEEAEPDPEEPASVTPRCELVEGDCSIYSDKFWELLAEYEEFEIETGVYPEPPECSKTAAEGRPVGCIQVITYLLPDGTFG